MMIAQQMDRCGGSGSGISIQGDDGAQANFLSGPNSKKGAQSLVMCTDSRKVWDIPPKGAGPFNSRQVPPGAPRRAGLRPSGTITCRAPGRRRQGSRAMFADGVGQR